MTVKLILKSTHVCFPSPYRTNQVFERFFCYHRQYTLFPKYPSIVQFKYAILVWYSIYKGLSGQSTKFGRVWWSNHVFQRLIVRRILTAAILSVKRAHHLIERAKISDVDNDTTRLGSVKISKNRCESSSISFPFFVYNVKSSLHVSKFPRSSEKHGSSAC